MKGVYLASGSHSCSAGQVLFFGYTFKMGRQNLSYSVFCFGSLLRRFIFQGY